MKADRPVVLSARFSKAEERMIARVAEHQGLTVSDYVRVSVIMGVVLDGDSEAIKYVAGEARVALAEKLSNAVGLKATRQVAPALASVLEGGR